MMRLATFVALIAAQPVGPNQVWQGVPPGDPGIAGVSKTGGVVSMPTLPIQALAHYSVDSKQVTFDWHYPLAHSPWPSKSEIEQVSYWPTEVATFDETTLVVAGKGAQGATIIERWDFVPQASYPPPQVELLTGETVYPVLPPSHTRSMIRRESTVGRDMVVAMLRMRGTSSMLVYYYDSRDLYMVDVNTGAPTLVYSSSSNGSGVPVQTALDDEFDFFGSSEHLNHGYLYVFNKTGAGSRLVFRDTDKDGDLDDSFVWTDADWEAQGLYDNSLYVQ